MQGPGGMENKRRVLVEEGYALKVLDGEVDLFVEVAIELADVVGVGGVAAVGGGEGEVGVAVLVFELVVAGGVGEAGEDGVGGGVVEFDDGAAEGLVAGVGDGASAMFAVESPMETCGHARAWRGSEAEECGRERVIVRSFALRMRLRVMGTVRRARATCVQCDTGIGAGAFIYYTKCCWGRRMSKVAPAWESMSRSLTHDDLRSVIGWGTRIVAAQLPSCGRGWGGGCRGIRGG